MNEETSIFLPIGTLVQFPSYVTLRFEPLPDITAYELAVIFQKVFGRPVTKQEYDMLDPAVQRHLPIVERS